MQPGSCPSPSRLMVPATGRLTGRTGTGRRLWAASQSEDATLIACGERTETEQERHPDRSMDHSHASFDAYMKFLAGPSADGTPVVLETEHALSLHFDLLATQSFMSRRDPD